MAKRSEGNAPGPSLPPTFAASGISYHKGVQKNQDRHNPDQSKSTTFSNLLRDHLNIALTAAAQQNEHRIDSPGYLQSERRVGRVLRRIVEGDAKGNVKAARTRGTGHQRSDRTGVKPVYFYSFLGPYINSCGTAMKGATGQARRDPRETRRAMRRCAPTRGRPPPSPRGMRPQAETA